jgi:hypothetical protein
MLSGFSFQPRSPKLFQGNNKKVYANEQKGRSIPSLFSLLAIGAYLFIYLLQKAFEPDQRTGHQPFFKGKISRAG